jgi:transcriptional regulator with XRE-family HTH domain
MMAAKHISSNRAFARACGVHDRRVSDWLNHRLPSADNLRQIADRFGISIDWLLGFDVPMQRNERSRIGALSIELDRLLSQRRPPAGFAPELGERESSELANDLVDEWWRTRLLAHATEAARKFRELAFEIQKAIRPPHESEDAGREGRYTINQCLWVAAKLESPLVEWESVADFRFAYNASQHIHNSDAPVLGTPFRVMGGWAFLWRYPDRDLAIYIEPGEEWGGLGEVKIKVGTKRRPRFLVEGPPILETPKRRRRRRRLKALAN